MPPKLLARNNDRTGGVLPVSAAARTPSKPQAAGSGSSTAANARLKLEIRRLPPGLTLSEFEETLGAEWKLGAGKIDWREYRPGKTRVGTNSTSATMGSSSKMSEQSRCYVHVVNEAAVKEFEARFLQVVFHDAAGTYRISDLRHLPPTLGFAPNQRTPLLQPRPRVDNRQGTIDQDPEFIAFLEAETLPIVKPAAIDSAAAAAATAAAAAAAAGGGRKEDDIVGGGGAVKSTPLIDDLREKKANRAKAALAKAEKAKEKEKEKEREREKEREKASSAAHTPKKSTGKDPVTNTVPTTPTIVQKESSRDATSKQQKVEHTGKVLNKQAANRQQKSQQPSQQQQQQQQQQVLTTKPANTPKSRRQTAAAQPSNNPPSKPTNTASTPSTTAAPATTPTTPSQRGSVRPRGNTDGIKKMLQKDLGIKPKPQSTAPSVASNATSVATTASASATTTTPTPQATPSKPARQPQIDSKGSGTSTPHEKRAPAAKAYLKHANPSQGMTEVLIQSALSDYGKVTSVTIDPRKGTAIAIFESQEDLKKALDAKRIPVANGAVEVLEFRERAAGGGGRGGSRAGRGGARAGREAAGSAGHATTGVTASVTSTTTAPAPAAGAT